MFCDLVNSTHLSVQLDPEDMGDVIRAYQEIVSEAVRRFDGYTAKFMGDGVLVYFGYPNAQERMMPIARFAPASRSLTSTRPLSRFRGRFLDTAVRPRE